MEIDDITVQQYINAFNVVDVNEVQRKLIILNYDAPEHTIASIDMASKMGFAGMAAANLKYGTMARKFCEHFGVDTDPLVGIFCWFRKRDNGWLWILRPKVVLALEKVGWVSPKIDLNDAVQEVENYKETAESNIDETERDAVIKSRVGQGKFRTSLIEMWEGCSVTEILATDVLRASHIKPWRFSTNAERLDPYNGLLLIPNLDALFDLGLISFTGDGEIIISNRLSSSTLSVLGISAEMSMRKVDNRHLPYLKFHRENIFKP